MLVEHSGTNLLAQISEYRDSGEFELGISVENQA